MLLYNLVWHFKMFKCWSANWTFCMRKKAKTTEDRVPSFYSLS